MPTDRVVNRGGRATESPWVPSWRTLLRPAILVLLKERDDYGYALVQRLATAGLEHVDPAALYRTLRALEEEGFVRSRWAGAERGAPRRVYALTDAGEGRLRQSLAAVADQRDILARLVDRGLGRPPTQPSRPSTSPAGHAARLLQSV